MHLFWDLPSSDLVEVRATIEVLEPPPPNRLVFWALQANFTDERGQLGAGHFGLQHHPEYPGRCAINWGGYYSQASGRSGELPGSALAAPSALSNANTCNFSWQSGVPYTYRIHRAPEQGWRGSVIEADGTETVVRDLYGDGHRLSNPMVWTESFANCDDPTSTVRWSSFVGIESNGAIVSPRSVRVNYQKEADGGCSNTSIEPAGNGFVQRTNAVRSHASGSRLAVAS